MPNNNRHVTMQTIFDNMGVLKRLMHAQFQRGNSKLDLPLSQLQLLGTVYHNQPLSHKALAKRLSLTPGAVSQLLEGLHERDLIVRTPSATDRRVQYISLSKRGKQVLDKLQKIHEAMFLEAFATLDDAEVTAYLRAQQKLIDWLEATNSHTK